MDEYEKARKLRFPQTGQWLLEDSKYQAWKNLVTFNANTDDDDTHHNIDWRRRTLKLQGKSVLYIRENMSDVSSCAWLWQDSPVDSLDRRPQNSFKRCGKGS